MIIRVAGLHLSVYSSLDVYSSIWAFEFLKCRSFAAALRFRGFCGWSEEKQKLLSLDGTN